MAAIITQISRSVVGASFVTSSTVQADASYPPGGYTITPQMLGLNSFIRRLYDGSPFNFASASVVPVFVPTVVNNIITSIQFQLQVFATGAEVAGATNVSADSYVLTVEGV